LPTKSLKVSANGNAVGQVLLRYETKNGAVRIVLHIHPKMWNTPNFLHVDLDLDELDTFRVNQLHSFEMQTLNIKSRDETSLNMLVDQLKSFQVDSNSYEDDNNSTRLFSDAPSTSSISVPISNIVEPRRNLWDLLAALEQESQDLVTNLVRIPNYADDQIDVITLSESILKHKALERIVSRLFVIRLEENAHLLKPLFVENTIETRYFRGRVDTLSITKFTKRIRQTYISHVSELSRNNQINQLILGALAIVSGKLLAAEGFTPRLIRLRKFFAGVSVLSNNQLFKLAQNFKLRSTKNRLAEIVILAKMIIFGVQQGIGDVRQSRNLGLATGLYLSSARLWEVLLSNRKIGEEYLLAPYKKALAIRSKDRINVSNRKQPDLCVLNKNGDVVALVDAKYKTLDHTARLNVMPNSDQYNHLRQFTF